MGDLDGDGVGDLAVGAYRDDDGGDARGAVWILFFNTDGTVKSHQKISDIEGGFKGILDDGDNFGFRMASLGDLDGDGPSVLALAVGAQGDDDGDFNHGAVWILFLNVDSTATVWAIWPWGPGMTTTGARTAARCGSCSSMPTAR